MVTITVHPLRDFLIEAYAQQKRQQPGTGLYLKVDDRNNSDKCDAFCDIYLSEMNQQHGVFRLTLKNVPYDDQVEKVVDKYKGKWSGSELQKTLVIPVSKSSAPYVHQLAGAIRKVVGRGRRYDSSNWKWVAPRTADSLERLAGCLKAFRHQQKTANSPKPVVSSNDSANTLRSPVQPEIRSPQKTSFLDEADIFVALGLE